MNVLFIFAGHNSFDMKARIIETGEVLRVDTVTDDYVYLTPPQGGDPICLLIERVELLDDSILHGKTSVDWEQRRYEIAKDVMAAYMSNGDFPESHSEDVIARWSTMAADRLIDELKKASENRKKRGFQD